MITYFTVLSAKSQITGARVRHALVTASAITTGFTRAQTGHIYSNKQDSKNIENIKVYRGYNRNNEIIFWQKLRIRQKPNIYEYFELNFLTTLFYKLTVSKTGPEIIKSCESVKKKALHGSIT